jgi:hypothetical protein
MSYEDERRQRQTYGLINPALASVFLILIALLAIGLLIKTFQ